MSLLDIILPKECIFCSKAGEHICERCLRNIPKSLPRCFQCGKISKDGKLHNDCNLYKYDIRYIKGWDLEKREIFENQKCIGFFSPYSEMILDILKRYNLNEGNLGEIAMPIKTDSRIDYELNKYLAQSMRGKNENYVSFVGETIPNNKYILEQIEKERIKYKSILVISIF